jgi:hypothetical protein
VHNKFKEKFTFSARYPRVYVVMSASPADMSIEVLILDLSMAIAGEVVLPNMRRLKTHP